MATPAKSDATPAKAAPVKYLVKNKVNTGKTVIAVDSVLTEAELKEAGVTNFRFLLGQGYISRTAN